MSLTKEQVMERNLTLAETHLLGILEHPQLLNSIPDSAHIIFLPADDRDLLAANLDAANRLAHKLGGNGSREPTVFEFLPVEELELAPA